LVLGVTVKKDWKNGMWAFGIHIKDISIYHKKLTVQYFNILEIKVKNPNMQMSR